jgi:hypothetical protein
MYNPYLLEVVAQHQAELLDEVVHARIAAGEAREQD